MSPSLTRARKPFILTNVLIGGTLFAFAVGVYVYSISAVKQDDFSDVEDLLPPLEERRKLQSIEDEQRAQSSLQSIASALPLGGGARPPANTATPLPYATSSAASPSKAIPQPDLSGQVLPLASSTSRTGTGIFGTRRLNEIDWVKKRGLVDPKGNVLVWGAPDVERIGRISGGTDGKRLV
ncbi:mitochondrial protein [Kwoniella heveanensis CBS 569]|nr:mitochondrial protein [Kwoniella heveanensis CBS 569]